MTKMILTVAGVAIGIWLGQYVGPSAGSIGSTVEHIKGEIAMMLGIQTKLSNRALDAERAWLLKQAENRQAQLRELDGKLRANDEAMACLRDLERAQRLDLTLPNHCELKPSS